MNAPVINVLEEKGHTVYQTRPEATVREAVEHMNEHHVGALLVVRDDEPVGMFTERDVLVRVVAAGLDPNLTPVESVMSTRIAVIGTETTIEEAMVLMTQKHHRHLPVVDTANHIIGIVSIRDLTRWIVREDESYIQNLNEYIWGPAAS